MVWTYSGDSGASLLDTVRFLIGDVDQNEQLLQDEEINYLLEIYSNVYVAAANAARSIAARFARQVDESVGDMQLSLAQRVTHYRQLAEELEKKASTSPAWEQPHEPIFKLEDC
jgi:hypothetical protein